MLITQNKERGEIIKCITVVDTKEGFHYKAISKEQKVLYLPKKLKLYQLISIKNFFYHEKESILIESIVTMFDDNGRRPNFYLLL